MTTRARIAYPALFAAFPFLGASADRPGYYLVSDAVVLSAIAVALVACGFGIAYGGLRTRLPAERAADVAAFLAFLGVIGFYGYGALASARDATFSHPAIAATLVIAFILVAGAMHRVGWLKRLPSLHDVGRFLTLSGTLLMVWSAGRSVVQRIKVSRTLMRSTLVHELEQPVPMRRAASLNSAPATEGRPKRDVYIILLDEYGSSPVLQERFGIDNRPFEDSLRALGFRVPASVRSNYANTLMSVTSLLNFAHMHRLTDGADRYSNDYRIATHLLEHSRATRFLKHEGYRFVFFPSSWFTPTLHNGDADEERAPPSSGYPWRMVWKSALLIHFSWTSAMRKVLHYLPTKAEVGTADAMHTFDELDTMPRSTRPTFVFAHVVAPHLPYMMDASCHPWPRDSILYKDASPQGRAALAAELQCVNRRLLRLARAIIARSSVPPIIIFQGDHGTQTLHPFDDIDHRTSVAQNMERFRTFGAYYLPDGGAAVLPDSMTLVNVLRYVFSYYFDADLPPLPNTMYFSPWQRPYRLTEIDSHFRAKDTKLKKSGLNKSLNNEHQRPSFARN